MAKSITLQQKKEWARTLYIKDDLNQKEIAFKTGVSQQTIGKWIEKEQWKKFRRNLTLTRSEQYLNMLVELEEINQHIKNKPENQRFADSKVADIRRKLVKDIKDLETETSVTKIVDVSVPFVKWINAFDLEKGKEIATLFDAFIKEKLR